MKKTHTRSPSRTLPKTDKQAVLENEPTLYWLLAQSILPSNRCMVFITCSNQQGDGRRHNSSFGTRTKGMDDKEDLNVQRRPKSSQEMQSTVGAKSVLFSTHNLF